MHQESLKFALIGTCPETAMTQFSCSKTQKPVALRQLIASSGEGQVWVTDEPQTLAKIYHHPTLGRQEKLRAMLLHSPLNPNSDPNTLAFAWPQSLVLNNVGMVVGFLMPRVEGSKELIDIYNPSRRKKTGLDIDWHFLHTTAHNIAAIIQSIHEAGYVLGDIKPQNILINNQAIPCIIDTDSFQVKHPTTGLTYRCLVGSDGFTPPELLGQDFAQIDQTEVHDRFRLGVIIYYLLFGSHPFQGRWIGHGETPDQTELIRQGHWAFGQQSLIRPSRLTIPLTIVHPTLQKCLWRCFHEGAHNPALRPTPKEWKQALRLAIPQLKVCKVIKSHYYHREEEKCYWCLRKSQLKTDIFDHSVYQQKFSQKRAISSGAPKSAVHPLPSPSPRLNRPVFKNHTAPTLAHRPQGSSTPHLLTGLWKKHARALIAGFSLMGGVGILGILGQEFSLQDSSKTQTFLPPATTAPPPPSCLHTPQMGSPLPSPRLGNGGISLQPNVPFCEESSVANVPMTKSQLQTLIPAPSPSALNPTLDLAPHVTQLYPAQKLVLPSSVPVAINRSPQIINNLDDNVLLNLAYSFYERGVEYSNIDLYRDALVYLQESLSYFEQAGETKMTDKIHKLLLRVRQDQANVEQ